VVFFIRCVLSRSDACLQASLLKVVPAAAAAAKRRQNVCVENGTREYRKQYMHHGHTCLRQGYLHNGSIKRSIACNHISATRQFIGIVA